MKKPICSIEGCFNPNHAKGYCRRHYTKFWKYGDPLAGRKHARGDIQKFIEEAAASSSKECIIWPYGTTGINSGYGDCVYNGKKHRAHRLILELSKGAPPSAKSLALHKAGICHNRLCVNPNHLRWGSNSDNQLDRVIDGTSGRGQKNPASKLTHEQVLNIKSGQLKNVDYAHIYGVSISAIGKIRNGQNWAWVK